MNAVFRIANSEKFLGGGLGSLVFYLCDDALNVAVLLLVIL